MTVSRPRCHYSIISQSGLGCPRNNQIFFSVRTETNRNSICLGLFREKHFFRFVSVFRTGIETTQTNRTLSKQTKTKQKKSQKNVFYQVSIIDTIFFFSRFGPKLNLFWLFFGFVFFSKPKNFFRFVSVFQTGIKTTKTNRNYGMGN